MFPCSIFINKNEMQKQSFKMNRRYTRVCEKKSNNLIFFLFLFTDKDFNFNENLLAAVEVVSLQFH